MRQQHKKIIRTFLYSLLRPFRWYLLGLILLTCVWAADQSIRPYLIKLLLDSIAQGSVAGPVVDRLILLAVTYVSVAACVIISFRVYDWLLLHMMPDLKQHLVEELAEHLMWHDYRFHQNRLVGSLTGKLNDVADGIPELIEIFIEQFWGNFLAVVIAIATMWCVSSSLAFAATIWVVCFVLGGLFIARRQQELADRASEARSVISGDIVDFCSNMGLVRLFCGRKHESQRLSGMLHKWVYAENKRARSAMALYIFQGTSFVVFEAICLWLLISGFQKGEVTSGDFALIFSINVSIIYALWRLSQDITKFSKELGGVTHGLRAILITKTTVDHPKAQDLVVQKGEIVFEHVNFRYHEGKPVFHDLSVTIKPGQKIGLVGYSGSGKSTFVNLLLRLFDIQGGKITIDGQNVAETTQDSMREAIAFIPQDPTLFHRSVRENISYGRFHATENEIIEAARHAHAHEFISNLHEGYNTLVGERGIAISGGQRQRIALARAFLKNAPILILDEATNSLDSITENCIQESLKKLMDDKTVFIIAHRLTTLLLLDRILVFDQGNIVEDGSHSELMELDGLYAALWRTQVCGLLPEYCQEGD